MGTGKNPWPNNCAILILQQYELNSDQKCSWLKLLGQNSSKFVRHHLWMIPYGGAVEITPVLLKYIHITLCLYTWKVGVDQFPTSLYVPAVLRSKYLIRRVYLWDNLLSVSVIIVFQEFIPLTEAFCSQLCAFSYFEVYTTMPPPPHHGP